MTFQIDFADVITLILILGKGVLLKGKTKWSVRYETPAGKTHPGETPLAQACRGRTAPGKRVPGVEINVITNLQFTSSLSPV
ncbi:hypothetical protein ACQKML_22960 [Peribacillus frigoritolerans]